MAKLTRIKFTKTNLANIKHHIGKRPKKYFATNCAHLCLFVQPQPSTLKSYYAQWSKILTNSDGTQRRVGRFKYLHRLYDLPLSQVMDEVKDKVKKWKNEKTTTSNINVGTLTRAFIAHGSKGYRVKSKGAKIKYKNKTRQAMSKF